LNQAVHTCSTFKS